jgi:NAD(P)H dehydrogenase (quinone)
MKVLVVYAHPNPNSFNHAVLESFTKGLEHGGNTFEVTDLYATKFNPSLGPEDFAQFTGEQMPQDVLDQQAKVARADGLAFIFPIWWLYCPAILKGWIDRVFSPGFAYKYTEKGMEGLLKHKKALLISTTGGPEPKYKASGRGDNIKKLFQDILKCDCGIANVEQVFLHALDLVDDKTRKKYLEQVYHLGKEF